MEKTLLEPESPLDGPVFHGVLSEPVYLDDDTDYVDDVATAAGPPEEEPAWTVDTGYGEFFAPAPRERPVL